MAHRETARSIYFSSMVFLLSFVPLLLGSCSGGLFSTPIAKIQSSPREYDGRQVTVKGTVTDSAGLLFMKYFLLKDESGEIPVVTERILPKKGETISVTGVVTEAFSLGDKQVIVIVESSR